MAYTVQLSDGTNTVNLVDGTTYQVLPNGIQHGPPSPRRAMSPESLLEDGSDLIEERFSNRRVTLRLHIMGATKDALIQGVRDIQALLETGRSRQVTGFGPDVTLTLQWDGAANSFTLDVLDGQLFYPCQLVVEGASGPQPSHCRRASGTALPSLCSQAGRDAGRRHVGE